MPASATFTAAPTSAANLTTYTFSGASIGTEAADRYVLVCIGSRQTGANLSVSSVTVGGNAASSVLNLDFSGTENDLSMWMVAVPTGTTADIVVTFNTATSRCLIAVFALTGIASATPVDTATSAASDPITGAVDVPAGGTVVAFAYSQTATSATWGSDLTERSDAQAEVTCSSASADFASAQTVTASCDWATSDTPGLIVAAWEAAAAASVAGTVGRGLTKSILLHKRQLFHRERLAVPGWAARRGPIVPERLAA